MAQANYVLVYSENTDCGDPTQSVSMSFFETKELAQEGMSNRFGAVRDILHFGAKAFNDEHYVEETEDSIYVHWGIDSMRWAIEPILLDVGSEYYELERTKFFMGHQLSKKTTPYKTFGEAYEEMMQIAKVESFDLRPCPIMSESSRNTSITFDKDEILIEYGRVAVRLKIYTRKLQ